MKLWVKVMIFIVLIGFIGGVFIFKNVGSSEKAADSQNQGKNLPILIDLGAGTCEPCKMMAPILEELQKEYAGKVKVEVIDINENRQEANKYKIRVIPTQIFFNAKGEEVYRHEGFMPKEDIVQVFREMGVK